MNTSGRKKITKSNMFGSSSSIATIDDEEDEDLLEINEEVYGQPLGFGDGKKSKITLED